MRAERAGRALLGRAVAGAAAMAALSVLWTTRGTVLGAGVTPLVRGAAVAAPASEDRQLFEAWNERRRHAGSRALVWDEPSVAALRAVATEALSGRKPDQAAFGRQVAARRGQDPPWRYRLIRWEGEGFVEEAFDSPFLADPEYTHGAVGLARDASGVNVLAVYLCRPMPRLGRAHANGPNGTYLVRCPNCGQEQPYNLDFPDDAQFYCPRCKTTVSAYLDDTKRVNHWATWYAQPFAPDQVTNPFLAWQWVNERIRYDHRKADHDLPGWQSPRETCQRSTGVCRDTAVLLAAWLRALGHDARAVTGMTGPGLKDAHAWVVLFDGPTAYLLESAIDGRMSGRYPPRLETVTDYVPTEMMFDDKRVWVNRGQQKVRDYSSPSVWLEIKENP